MAEISDQDRAMARKLCPCTCYAPRRQPESMRGPLRDGAHYTGCPSDAWDDVAAALADARSEGEVARSRSLTAELTALREVAEAARKVASYAGNFNLDSLDDALAKLDAARGAGDGGAGG